MPTLWQQARAQMRPGSLLLSYEFAVDGVMPDIGGGLTENGPVVYGWRF